MSVKIKTNKPKVYICPVCNKETGYYDMCDGCWQVESSIENYLSTKEGIERIKVYLKEAIK